VGEAFLLTLMSKFVDSKYKTGSIKNVTLKNFMCHSNLRIDLGPHINFITGVNGSGKSAIMAAVFLIFGSRASQTYRGKSLDSFIKEGHNFAEITICLSNNPFENPYKFEKFGEEIHIDRIIKRDGTSSFRIKSIQGNIIGTKKEEIFSICDYFGIQIENPLVMLTQDLSKKFLSLSDPKELYDLFLDATHIKSLSEDYNFAASRVKASENYFNDLNEAIPSIEQKIMDLQTCLKHAELFRESESLIENLRKELIWKKVEEQETKIASIHNEIETNKNIYNEDEINLMNFSQKQKILLKNIEEFEGRIANFDSEINVEKGQKSFIQKKIENTKELIRGQENDLKEANKELETMNSQLRDLSEETKTPLISNDYSHLENQIKNAEKELNQTQIIISNSLKVKNDIESKLKAFSRNAQDGRSHLNLVTQQLQEPKQYTDPKLINLLKKIQEESLKFKSIPIGPIYQLLSIKDIKWKLSVNSVIGSYLDNFIVTNHTDREILSKLMEECDKKSPIIVFQNPINQHSTNFKSGDNITSFIDLVEFKSEEVKNLLIIFESIDRIVVTPDRNFGLEFINKKNKNIDLVLTTKEKLQVYKGSVSIFQLQSTSNIALLGITQNSQLVESKKSLSKSLVEINDNLNLTTKQLEKVDDDLENFKITESNLQNSIYTLKFRLEEFKKNYKISSDTFLLDETTKIANKISNTKVQILELSKSILTSKDDLHDLNRELEKYEKKIRKIIDDYQDFSKLFNTSKTELSKYELSLDVYRNKLKKARALINELLVKCEEEKEFLVIIISEATKFSPRIVSNKSTEEIEKLLHKQMIVKEARKGNILNISDLNQKLTIATEDYDQICLVRDETKMMNSTLLNSMEKRLGSLSNFRSLISKRSSLEFCSTMSSRGFFGQLQFDHHNRELSIIINSSNEVPKQSDVKQLSGGEKSFGTSCFLISLWDAIGSPFRCLDEFDVFMVSYLLIDFRIPLIDGWF
jgi:structural maintenance of chromosomes protein 6